MVDEVEKAAGRGLPTFEAVRGAPIVANNRVIFDIRGTVPA